MTEEKPLYTTNEVHKDVIGLHLQEPTPDWLDAVGDLSIGSPAGFFQVENITEAKQRNAGIFAFHRYFVAHQSEYLDAADKHAAARSFFDSFIDETFMTHAANVDAVCELNEYATNTAWTRAVAEVWHNEYRTRLGLSHIRLILCRKAIGNDIHDDVAEIATTYDCLVSYHGYIPVRYGVVLGSDGQADPEWRNYSGRWVVMDERWKSQGYEVDWVFTEGGAVGWRGDPKSPHLSPDDGWLHPDVYNGNLEAYISCLQYWAQRTAEWNAANNNRAIGAVLFNTNVFSGWQWFRTIQPQLGHIFRHFAQWQPDITPPPVDEWQRFVDSANNSQTIAQMKGTALQEAIMGHGLQMLGNEYIFTYDDGSDWVCRLAGNGDGNDSRWVYRFLVGQYDPSTLVIDEVSKV